MVFPARNLHWWGIFHGYVSHNQMVKVAAGVVARATRSEHSLHLAPIGRLETQRANVLNMIDIWCMWYLPSGYD